MNRIKFYLKFQAATIGTSLLIGITDPAWYLFYLIAGVPVALCKSPTGITGSIRY